MVVHVGEHFGLNKLARSHDSEFGDIERFGV